MMTKIAEALRWFASAAWPRGRKETADGDEKGSWRLLAPAADARRARACRVAAAPLARQLLLLRPLVAPPEGSESCQTDAVAIRHGWSGAAGIAQAGRATAARLAQSNRLQLALARNGARQPNSTIGRHFFSRPVTKQTRPGPTARRIPLEAAGWRPPARHAPTGTRQAPAATSCESPGGGFGRPPIGRPKQSDRIQTGRDLKVLGLLAELSGSRARPAQVKSFVSR